MDKVFKVLIFFRIVDGRSKVISLTNMVILASIYSLLKVDAVSFAEVATLLTAVAASTSKKLVNKSRDTVEAQLKEKVELELGKAKEEIIKLQADDRKDIDEIKAKMSNQALKAMVNRGP